MRILIGTVTAAWALLAAAAGSAWADVDFSDSGPRDAHFLDSSRAVLAANALFGGAYPSADAYTVGDSGDPRDRAAPSRRRGWPDDLLVVLHVDGSVVPVGDSASFALSAVDLSRAASTPEALIRSDGLWASTGLLGPAPTDDLLGTSGGRHMRGYPDSPGLGRRRRPGDRFHLGVGGIGDRFSRD